MNEVRIVYIFTTTIRQDQWNNKDSPFNDSTILAPRAHSMKLAVAELESDKRARKGGQNEGKETLVGSSSTTTSH